MRFAYLVLSPLLLLGGCASSGMGPHAHDMQGQAMQNCPMASPPPDGGQQHGAMTGGDRAGQMMGQGQVMQDMHPDGTAHCPKGQQAAPATTTPPADPHQH
ncbi:MAG: hypothetical protein FD124_1049 [Alphaproteobacteria bacterium]|nr:MAG: hypothetical protein FD160_1028 [Caulobacteraceae bacterium]TPW07602.1 MAG: hypothetical protein FD124_1049 [Alphaproteobacteria bacterium]